MKKLVAILSNLSIDTILKWLNTTKIKIGAFENDLEFDQKVLWNEINVRIVLSKLFAPLVNDSQK